MTRLSKRLHKLEEVAGERDPIQVAKDMLWDEDRALLEERGYDRAAFQEQEADWIVWARWQAALAAAKAGLKYPPIVLSDSDARL